MNGSSSEVLQFLKRKEKETDSLYSWLTQSVQRIGCECKSTDYGNDTSKSMKYIARYIGGQQMNDNNPW